MPIYTGTGDDGSTGLFGNERVPKEHLRIQAYGTVDELNAVLGLVRAEALAEPLDQRLKSVQDTLFEMGADLATPAGKASVATVTAATTAMESWIDESEAQLPALQSFVLPGGHRSAALMHVARTVARRAERCFWALQRTVEDVPDCLGVYLNRLSDLLFSWARLQNRLHDEADVPWQRNAGNGDSGGVGDGEA